MSRTGSTRPPKHECSIDWIDMPLVEDSVSSSAPAPGAAAERIPAIVAAEAAVRNCEAIAADPLESRKGVILLLAAGLMLPAGSVALRDDEFAEPLVSRLSMMLEYSSRKFGNVTLSAWTTSGPCLSGLS